jgi:hypothetical protein
MRLLLACWCCLDPLALLQAPAWPHQPYLCLHPRCCPRHWCHPRCRLLAGQQQRHHQVLGTPRQQPQGLLLLLLLEQWWLACLPSH